MPPEPSVTSASEGPRRCTLRYSSALLPKSFERPGPKSVSPATYCSGVEVVVWWRWIVDMRAPFLGGVTKFLSSQFVLHGDAFAHFGSSVPACSATMYLAYHSGQFGSASPMRFSCWPWGLPEPGA